MNSICCGGSGLRGDFDDYAPLQEIGSMTCFKLTRLAATPRQLLAQQETSRLGILIHSLMNSSLMKSLPFILTCVSAAAGRNLAAPPRWRVYELLL